MSMRSSGSFLDEWWKVGGAAGILFLVFFIIGAIVLQGNVPMPDDSAGDIKKYFVDHPRKYMVGDFLIGFGFVFLFLPFASCLRTFLWLAEGPSGVWSRLVFAGALLFAGVGAATSGVQGSLAYTAAKFGDDNLLKTMIAMSYYTFTTAVPFLAALMVFSASLVILRTAVLWNWLGFFGIALSVAAVISSLAVLNDDPMGPLGILGLVAFIGLAVWILLTSIGLLMKEAPPDGVVA
jgi:hypothetical protein